MSAYEAYLARVAEYRAGHPEQRDGQAHSNVWLVEYAGRGRGDAPAMGGEQDPFYVDAKLQDFLQFVREQLAAEGVERV